MKLRSMDEVTAKLQVQSPTSKNTPSSLLGRGRGQGSRALPQPQGRLTLRTSAVLAA